MGIPACVTWSLSSLRPCSSVALIDSDRSGSEQSDPLSDGCAGQKISCQIRTLLVQLPDSTENGLSSIAFQIRFSEFLQVLKTADRMKNRIFLFWFQTEKSRRIRLFRRLRLLGLYPVYLIFRSVFRLFSGLISALCPIISSGSGRC